MNPNDFTPKNPSKFCCETCDFKCCNKKDWNRHILTDKHKNLINPNNFTPKNPKQFVCINCERSYKHLSSLCIHKKKCNDEFTIDGINIKDKDALVLHLLKKNTELHNKILEIASNPNSITNNTNSHNTNINNTNNSFNLNFFLNETCKDAMNISDFVSSIKVNLDDLENTGRRGYIEGISNIILKNLNNLEQQLRPVHCSDSKREVFYIKDNNEWIKENEDKPILTKTIKTIANENIKQIKNWREKYPDCTASDSKKNSLYLKIVSNSMNGLTEEEGNKNINKIISNCCQRGYYR